MLLADKMGRGEELDLKEKKVAVFGDRKIRKIWHMSDWWFSVVDVVGVLSESNRSRKYWKVLKYRLVEEESQVVTDCNQLKMMAEDGKMRETDALDTKGILRIIQSIPSKKAEPFENKIFDFVVTGNRLQVSGVCCAVSSHDLKGVSSELKRSLVCN